MMENSGPRQLLGPGEQDTLDLDAAEEATLPYSCGGWQYASFQADKVGDGTWSAGVLTVQESNDGVDFHNTTVTIGAGSGFGARGSAVLTLSAPYCRVKVTTDNTVAARAKVTAYFWNANLRQNGV